MVPLSQRESSSDVSTTSPESATSRYLKLVAAAAAFSLAAYGIKKVVENLNKWLIADSVSYIPESYCFQIVKKKDEIISGCVMAL